jgi:glycosyltransferase XagB
LNTVCVQCKLNFYNSTYNYLTKSFSLEYGMWFDFFLAGLSKLEIPIPLGGTSNHFNSKILKEIGSWDPYNVTEDADIGWRLSREKYKTVLIDSYTYEEANSKIWSWIKQRTRWQKGFLITFLVHTKNPVQLFKSLGFWKGTTSIFVFASNFLMPIINPLLWAYFLLWLLSNYFNLPIKLYDLPFIWDLIGIINLVLGNALYVIVHYYSAKILKQNKIALYSLLMPFYWILISVAAYRSIYQFVFQPFVWEKTPHGIDT